MVPFNTHFCIISFYLVVEPELFCRYFRSHTLAFGTNIGLGNFFIEPMHEKLVFSPLVILEPGPSVCQYQENVYKGEQETVGPEQYPLGRRLLVGCCQLNPVKPGFQYKQDQ